MRKNGWKAETSSAIIKEGDGLDQNTNLEELAQDQIAKLIVRSLKGTS